jgi:endoglucanase
LWLHKATGNADYLSKAVSYYDSFGLQSDNNVFEWDLKTAGAKILLAQIQGGQFSDDAEQTCQAFVNYRRSPKGRSVFGDWGSLRLAANAAFICLQVLLVKNTHL